MADRKISQFLRVSALSSGYIVPLVDLSQANLIDQNIFASIDTWDNRYASISGGAVTNPFQVPAGSVSAPGLGVGSVDKGVYAPSSTTLGVAAGNTQIVVFASGLSTFNNSVTVSGSVLASGGSAARPGISLYQLNTGLYADGTSLNGTVAGTGVFTATNNSFVINNNTLISGGNATFNGYVLVSGGSVAKPGLAVGTADYGLFKFDANTLSVTASGIETIRHTANNTRFLKDVSVDNTISATVVSGAAGTAAAPSVRVGDSDTGLFLSAPNILGVTAGGTEVTQFTPSGVTKFVGSGAIDLPVGTSAQRPLADQGMLRFNSELVRFEGYNGTAWTSVGGGATGSGVDEVFILNQTSVNGSYNIPSGYNAMSTGPVTIASGVIVTVTSGSAWVII